MNKHDHQPLSFFSSKEWDQFKQIFESGKLSSGSRTSRHNEWKTKLENTFSNKFRTKYSLSTNSGTSALHAGLHAIGIKRGEHVIVSPLTCYAGITPIFQEGGIPIFCDVDEETLAIDPHKLEKRITPKTKAVILTYLYGLPAHTQQIVKICRAHGIALIEDCAHVPGLKIGKKYAGTFGDIGCFSFAQEKVISIGEGGMTITSKKKYAEKLQFFREGGKKGFRKYVPHGLNYRMTEYQAFLALRELTKLNRKLATRRKIANIYFEKKLLANAKPVNNHRDCIQSVALFQTKHFAPDVANRLYNNGIDAKDIYAPLNESNVFKNKKLLTEALRHSGKDMREYQKYSQPTPFARKASKHYFYIETSLQQSFTSHQEAATKFENTLRKK